MRHGDNDDEQDVITDGVEDPEVADPQAPSISAAQWSTGRRAWVLGEHGDGTAQARSVCGIDARGTDTPESDIDLVVTLPPETSLMALARLERDISAVLGCPVDVVSAESLRESVAERVRLEGVPL